MQYLVIGSNLGQVKKQKQKEKRNRPTMEYLLLSNLLFCFCFVSIKLGILRFFFWWLYAVCNRPLRYVV
jgi:hypothetical protein